MIERETDGLDFGVLRRAIEGREPDHLLGFYEEDAQLTVVGVPSGPPFELLGKAEIAKYLRAVFRQEALHRIEEVVFEEGRVEYREVCEYPDGARLRVATTLEVVGGRILRQVETVTRDESARSEGLDEGGEQNIRRMRSE